MNIILIYFAIKYKGDWDAIYKALEDKEKVTLKQLRILEKSINEGKVNAITILDMDYPNQLKKAYKPPFVLFYEGNKKNLEEKFICLTGNKLKQKNKKWIDESIDAVNSKYNLITPLQKGVDEYVYKNTKRKTCLVLASGLNIESYAIPINDINKDTIIISEYPKDVNVNKTRTRARNRIIAAMSDSLVLFSSNKKSSLMNLVSNILNQGKEVYCFPGTDKEEDGNTELIKQGANLITKISEID